MQSPGFLPTLLQQQSPVFCFNLARPTLILCDHGSSEPASTEELILFVSQLNASGVDARIATDTFVPPAHYRFQYEAEPYLCDPMSADISAMIVLSADVLDVDKMKSLRRLSLAPDIPVYALGRFPETQTRINILSKMSYVLGRDPEIVDLSANPGINAGKHYAFGVEITAAPRPKPVIMLIAPDLEDPRRAEGIYALTLSRPFKTIILTNGKSKDSWHKTFGYAADIYHFGELPPSDISAMADICVVMSNIDSNPRAKTVLNNMIISGAPVINGTNVVFDNDDYSVRGPVDASHLGNYIIQEILPNKDEISAAVRNSKRAKTSDIARISDLPGVRPIVPKKAPETSKILFVPTNGVGLGHAQRCSLVATELGTRENARFAAFPSCLPMLNRYGFDGLPLVSRSPIHEQPHANDLVNYTRLSSAARQGAALVFDGGYVFDSIFRTIARHRLKSVWIRRGLWQAGQSNGIALDREKIFDRVIVPLEAFEELNANYSTGEHLKMVGPIVQIIDHETLDREAIRLSLQNRYKRKFTKLVVSMLGGGVAADRTAQVQAICAGMEERDDTLHLVVIWPTAKTDPGWFAWNNSKIVRTHHASALVAACDLFVSAVGYNSFHEVLYNRIPTIFIPQMASYMDDQRARAEAAAERGAAILVEPDQVMTLEREISACLDAGKSSDLREALARLDLPATGNLRAAQHIEELANVS